MRYKVKRLISMALGIAVIVAGLFAVERLRQSQIQSSDFYMETARVQWVYDGDTIKVTLLGDTEEEAIVRMVGLDAPESVHPIEERNTEYGTLASAYTKEQIKPGQILYLTRDVSDKDQYERLVRFVWTEVPEHPWAEAELLEKCYNTQLIRAGYALAESYVTDTSAVDLFYRLQEEARHEGAGLWSLDGWTTLHPY